MPLLTDLTHIADYADLTNQLQAVGVFETDLRSRLVDVILDTAAATGLDYRVFALPIVTAAASGYFTPAGIAAFTDLGIPSPAPSSEHDGDFSPLEDVLAALEERFGGSWQLIYGHPTGLQALQVFVVARLVILAGRIDDLTARLIRRSR
jgi:hypothetical protein